MPALTSCHHDDVNAGTQARAVDELENTNHWIAEARGAMTRIAFETGVVGASSRAMSTADIDRCSGSSRHIGTHGRERRQRTLRYYLLVAMHNEVSCTLLPECALSSSHLEHDSDNKCFKYTVDRDSQRFSILSIIMTAV